MGVFTLDQCVVDDTYKTTLAKFFRAVHEQKLPRVVVDLRRNGGGNSQVTDEFLRYVDVEQYLSFGSLVRGSSAVRAQRGQLAKGSVTYPQPRARNPVHEDPPPFRGELLVLAGNRTFSSGTWFATVVQDNGLGKVVGEPTGGRPSCFGDILSFTLPNSGLSYTLSFKQWLRPKPERDPADTLAPDVAVPRTRADVATGRDSVLEWLRQKR